MSDSRALTGASDEDNLPKIEETASSKAAEGQEVAKKKKPASSEKNKGTKKAKGGIFHRIVLFVSQVIAELKKVKYPSKSETWTYFVVVLVFVVAIMVFSGALDYGFSKLNVLIFG